MALQHIYLTAYLPNPMEYMQLEKDLKILQCGETKPLGMGEGENLKC